MSDEPCLEPCPAHLCLELTKVGMCRHEVATLRTEVARLTKILDDRRCEECGGAGEHCIDRAYGGQHYQEMVPCPGCFGDGRTEAGAVAEIARLRAELRHQLEARASESQTLVSVTAVADQLRRELDVLPAVIAAFVTQRAEDCMLMTQAWARQLAEDIETEKWKDEPIR